MSAERRRFAYMLVIYACIGLLMGTGVLLSEKSLLAMCQKHCTVNSIFYSIFGESRGRAMLALLFYITSAGAIWYAIKALKKSKETPTN